MRARLLLALLLPAMAGCASAPRAAEAEARGYERGRAQAMKEQYWIIQNQQRTASPQPPKP